MRLSLSFSVCASVFSYAESDRSNVCELMMRALIVKRPVWSRRFSQQPQVLYSPMHGIGCGCKHILFSAFLFFFFFLFEIKMERPNTIDRNRLRQSTWKRHQMRKAFATIFTIENTPTECIEIVFLNASPVYRDDKTMGPEA